MKFLPALFKHILPIEMTCWTIIIFSQTGAGGNHSFVHCMYKAYEGYRHLELREKKTLNLVSKLKLNIKHWSLLSPLLAMI
jgi:hypothetical protein